MGSSDERVVALRFPRELNTPLPTSFRVAFELTLREATYTFEDGWKMLFEVRHRLLSSWFASVNVTVTQSELEAVGLNSIRDYTCEKAEEAFVQAVKQWQADATKEKP